MRGIPDRQHLMDGLQSHDLSMNRRPPMVGIAERAVDHGITIKARYANRLEHINFFIVEATSMEAIDALFDPVLEMGQWYRTPVIEK